MKKLFTLLIALVAGAGFAYAENGDCDCCRIDGYLYWNLRWSGKTAEVTTPQYCWYYQAEFNEITIPATVENEVSSEKQTYYTRGIAPNTFYDCKNITSVTPPPTGLDYIGSSAFENCTGLTSFTVQVTSLGNSAFKGCTSLNTVNLVDIQTIGAEAFSGCTALSSLFIYPSVETIGEKAFEDCTSLTSFALPALVTNLGANAFRGCTGISAFEVNEDNPNYMAEDGIIYSKDKTALVAYPYGKSDEEYHIPHKVQSIAAGTFSRNTHLTAVSTGNGVTTIGDYAFNGCTNLTSALLGNHVTSIGENAFFDCPALKSISIPNSVTTIGRAAFSNCPAMTSITIGRNVESIGQMAFFSCGSVTSIVCRATTPPALGTMVFGGIPSSEYEGLDPETCVLYVPKGSESLYANADQWGDFTHIVGLEELVPVSDDFEDYSASNITILAGQEGANVPWYDRYPQLMNGSKSDKWCSVTYGGEAYSARNKDIVVWKTATPVRMVAYTLTTGDDIRQYPARNWKAWTICGGSFASDEAAEAAILAAEGWTEIHKITDDVILDPQDTTDFRFAVSIPGTYQYYRLVIDDIVGPDNIQQMAELTMGIKDTPTDIDDLVDRQAIIRKFIKDGQLFILRDDKMYTITGARVQ